MTMGLKIHRMLKDERKDSAEMVEEAKKRKDVSDSILEMIYNKITGHPSHRRTATDCEPDEEEDEGEEEL